MDTCFLFTEYLNETGCLCLKLSAEGNVVTAPTQLEFKDIRSIQNGCTTILVESASQVSFLNLELPWLSERKARAAIPYALEDQLAQQVEDLHFAFDKQHYKNNNYLITVIAKHRMLYLMQLMDENSIDFEILTVDWFAIDEIELCVSGQRLLVNQDDFKGCLSDSLAQTYLKLHPLAPMLLFKDSQLAVNSETEINYAENILNESALELLNINNSNLENTRIFLDEILNYKNNINLDKFGTVYNNYYI